MGLMDSLKTLTSESVGLAKDFTEVAVGATIDIAEVAVAKTMEIATKENFDQALAKTKDISKTIAAEAAKGGAELIDKLKDKPTRDKMLTEALNTVIDLTVGVFIDKDKRP
ncbi:MAG: hypothetical protein LBT86_02520 [Deltaproteobacteria bacterium]|nr:hypothetical protein [Deltaproteobacteria bacterium]